MNVRRTGLLPILGGLLMFGAAAGAHAQVLNSDFTIAQQGVTYSNTIVVNKFDPTLGTLNSVDFIVTNAALMSGVTLENTAALGGNVSAEIFGTITLKNGSTALVTLSPDNTYTELVGKYDGAQDFSGGDTTNFGGTKTTNTNTTGTSSTSTGLAAFQGSGTFNLTWNATGGVTFTGTDGISTANLATRFDTNPNVTAGGNLRVRFNFTPAATTPEPGTFALLGISALSGVGLVLRRRK